MIKNGVIISVLFSNLFFFKKTYSLGKPVHNDKELFEFLILEGAQAGLK